MSAGQPCPHASVRRSGAGWVCTACGLKSTSARFAASAAPPSPWAALPGQGLVVWAVTLPAAVLIAWLLPFVHAIFSTFGVLCHELGHTVVAFATGHVAIPAFDLLHGGGVTTIFDRSLLLAAADLAIPCALAYRFRRSLPIAIACVALAATVALLMATGWDEALGLEMGHGGQLVAAGICLYQALAGTAVVNPAERWLYGLLGWSLGMDVATLSWSLIFDPDALAIYYQGKGGIDHDFVRLAEDHFSCSVAAVAWVNLLFCLAVPGLVVVWYVALRRRLSELAGTL